MSDPIPFEPEFTEQWCEHTQVRVEPSGYGACLVVEGVDGTLKLHFDEPEVLDKLIAELARFGTWQLT